MGENAHRFERRYDDGNSQFTLTYDTRVEMCFWGKGTMAGAHALLKFLDEVSLLVEPGCPADTVADLSSLSGSPLRAQFLLGRWLLTHREQVRRVAIVGARPWERRLATAVMKIARFKMARFFVSHEEAEAWLDVS